MAQGRPTKYKADYCDTLIAHLASGLSFESFAGVVGVDRDTLYEWAKKRRAFSDAKKIGEMRSLLWWERVSKAAMIGQPLKDTATGREIPMKIFNATVFVFTMKNRFGWRDAYDVKMKSKNDHTHTKVSAKEALKKRREENQARLDAIKKR